MWDRCVSLLRSAFRPSTAAAKQGCSSGESWACASEDDVVAYTRDVCVLALLQWAATWSGAAAAAATSTALCASVANFLESSLILVHVPSAHHLPRDHWHAAHESCEDVTAVWLEEVAGRIEWTVVQKSQQRQAFLPRALKVLADASNDFPQFPALRTLGDIRHETC
jgi:hypothetical protein